MTVSRRILLAAVIAAAFAVSSCQREPTAPKIDASSLQAAQLALSQPAWLHAHLPASTVAYARIASPWMLIGGAPSGRPLDDALAGEGNLKVVAALREAIGHDTALAKAGLTPYLLAVLNDLRSPIEVAMIDPIGIMSPDSQVLLTMRLAQTSVAELNARFAQFETAALKLEAPLDDQGKGRLASGMPLQFDAASGRLFVLASRKSPNSAQLANLVATAAKTSTAEALAKAIHAQEAQIDQSGQGTFAWLSLRGIGGLAAGAIPDDKVGTLPGDFTSKIESIAFGAGVVDGHARARLVVHAPQARMLAYLAPTRFDPTFKVVGQPRWAANVALPDAARWKTINDNLTLDFGAERAKQVAEAAAQIEKRAGLDLNAAGGWIGPEMIAFEDDAGTYTALRVNDRKALYAYLKTLTEQSRANFRTQNKAGVDIHSLSVDFSQWAETKPAISSQGEAWVTLLSRWGAPVHWMDDGDYLIFSQVPQALLDRRASKPDLSMADWLKKQAWQGQENLLGLTSVSQHAQRKAYYGYLNMLQMLASLSETPVDLLALPAAHTLNLPTEGIIGMSMGVTPSDLSINLTYEQQPLELLGGASGGSTTAIATVAILAAIAIPAYQDYIIRAQVTEGLVLASSAKPLVIEYYQPHGRWPSSNKQVGLDAPEDIHGLYVDRVGVSGDGAIEVQFGDTPPQKANTKLVGKTLLLVPEKSGAWQCLPDGISDKYLPAECRNP